MSIQELPQELTNQIAAGEVIERPASIVKELVENSLDAGSKKVRIEFENAGLKKISVQDDGVGIAKDEIDLAFKRHATSKIKTERDLFNISTLGFRGEALASMAAVAKVEIETSLKDQPGVKALFQGGKKINQETFPPISGTKISVKDLFYNTPARLKYLKSEKTEVLKIVDIVNRLALGHPEISFTLVNNGKVLLATFGKNNLRQDVAKIYSRNIAEKMYEVKAQSPDFEIRGLVSDPDHTRSNRSFITLLLNGRYIRNYQLTQAILEGYKNKLQAGRFPIAIIDIKLDPLLVDVNVHPTKQEVRLSKEQELEHLITKAIAKKITGSKQESLGVEKLYRKSTRTNVDQLKMNIGRDIVNTVRPTPVKLDVASEELQVSDQHSKFVTLNQIRNDDKYVVTSSWDENVMIQQTLLPFKQEEKEAIVVTDEEEVLKQNLPELKFIGQTKSYLLASQEDDLYLIEPLNALRRLSYDEIYQQFKDKKINQQSLLKPAVLEFSNLDYLKIKENLASLKELGIELEDFGQNSFLLAAYPVWIGDDFEKNVRTMINIYFDYSENTTKLFTELTSMITKEKVKRRKKLTDSEAKGLVDRLAKSTDPYHDGDGEVIIVKLTKNDLNKMFKSR
ncbi:DNA mismatch repair endonuclease MutL [Lactobacillus sp. PV012]|uniref:DNA mismatch repair endonuclease MutL n=1 Tax=Lactobacillus sp. PV012 TaxID=2594494 RepID=UPI00223F4F9A|nr:DNA mismatch repair endonuclease MutL [Lactobacillus sp. PV012]QNQ81903.1 DNA mismatch repair endonuclease MutL [Lactobacillus sp. PV012]